LTLTETAVVSFRTERPSVRSPRIDSIAYGFVSALGFVVLAEVGYAFYYPGSDVATFWPAAGFLLAILVRAETRAWPVILGFVSVAHATQAIMRHDVPPPVAVSFVVADVFEALLGALLIRRFFGAKLRFERVGEVIGLAIITGLITTPLSAILGALGSHFGFGRNAFFLLHRTWWFGDALGCLVVAPALLTLPDLSTLRDVERRRWIEAVLLATLSVFIAASTLGGRGFGPGDFGVPYLLLPFLFWAAIRFGTRGASLFTLVVAAIAVWNATRGRGPFLNSGTTAHDHVLALQSFVAVTYTAQLVAALHLENADALARLSTSRAQYRSLARAAPTAIFRTDSRGTVVYVNDRFAEMTGVPAPNAHGCPLESFVHPDDRSRLPRFGEKDAFESPTEDLRVVADDGRSTWVLARIVAESGASEGAYVGTFTDVTERHRAEDERASLESQLRQAQKMEAVGRLAGGVAHDFNNLLTAILGYGHVVIERLDEGSPLRAYVEQIALAGRRAASLTHQLLAFSRKQVLEPKVIDVDTVVEETSDMLRRLIGAEIELRIDLARDLPPTRVDPSQLVQVLVNLAVNARDAMENRPGMLTVETRFSEDGPERSRLHEPVEESSLGYVVLSVLDSGHGMDEETQRHLFEPFFTTKGAKGTGLGLATVYGIVRQSRGAILCSSHVGIGTRFDVYLPCVDEPLPVTRPAEAATESRRRPRDETILLVEDDDDVRSFVRHVLETSGYQVLAARRAEEAEKVSRRFDGPISLLITDVVMPGVPGPELARRLRVRRLNLPVLYISGYSDHPSLHRGSFRAHEQFLAKPFTPVELLTSVDRGVALADDSSIDGRSRTVPPSS